MLILPVTGLLLLQMQGSDADFARKIRELVHVALTTDDEKQETAARAEARKMFEQQGLPAIATVGDEAAYEFVFLTCQDSSPEFQKQVLKKAREGAAKQEIPADAVSFCEARVRQDLVKAASKRMPPANPALRDEIERLFKADQEVRQKDGFDAAKMARADREHRAALEGIFKKYGVPAYRLVGPEAAGDFVVMLQHQPSEFRAKMLPKLKALVDVGQANPGSYATMFDRLQSDAGKKQIYGQNLTCDAKNPQIHEGPIEDEGRVNERRAAVGLMRLAMYVQLVVETSPTVCAATPLQR